MNTAELTWPDWVGMITNGKPSNQNGNHQTEPNELAQVLSVKELMVGKTLTIPDYQRPYKWTAENVNQFVNDLIQHSDKEQYRIGNMVVHKKRDFLDIVDGQQRFITLLLLLKAVADHQESSLNGVWQHVDDYLEGINFSNEISRSNLLKNYQVIRQQSGELYRIRNFLINRVKIVRFILFKQSEAFQFFDSQNARGKDLYPHDLLKAYHLREFPAEEDHLKRQVVEAWEDMESNDLAELFSHYMYRIKAWSQGDNAWFFTKDDIDHFKGVTIEKAKDYPYINSYRLMHNRIDDITADMPSYMGSRKYVFPFQLDQVILNGRRFFEMITVYKGLIESIKDPDFAKKELDSTARRILKTITSYKGHNRTGDRYVYNLFMAALIYYVDKFGIYGLSEAIKRLFVWSYRLRLEMYAVRVETIANHAAKNFSDIGANNAFRIIRDAIHHTDIRKLVNKPITDGKRNEPELVKLMKELKINIEKLPEK